MTIEPSNIKTNEGSSSTEKTPKKEKKGVLQLISNFFVSVSSPPPSMKIPPISPQSTSTKSNSPIEIDIRAGFSGEEKVSPIAQKVLSPKAETVQKLRPSTTEEGIREKAIKSDKNEIVSEPLEIASEGISTENELCEIPPAKKILEDLINAGVEPTVAEKIAEGSQSRFEGWYEETSKGVKNIHGLKGVKIYFEPSTGLICVDIAQKAIANPELKTVKGFVRLDENGCVSNAVRYAPSKRLKETEGATKAEEVFSPGMQFEVEIREEMKKANHGTPISDLLPLFKISYVNAKGIVKTRYIAPRGTGTLDSLTFDINGNPKKNPKSITALKCCRDCARSLSQMHAIGYVHRDVSSSNVVVMTNEGKVSGKLADLEFVAKYRQGDPVKDAFIPCGSTVYAAPELLFHTARENDPRMEMYSFGVMLLEVLFPKYAISLRETEYQSFVKIYKQQISHPLTDEEKSKYCGEYLQTLETTRTMLEKDPHILAKCIQQLLSLNAEERPTSLEAYQAIDQYVKKPKEKKQV
jgi:hypothetical protein